MLTKETGNERNHAYVEVNVHSVEKSSNNLPYYPTNILKGSQTEGYKIISMTAVHDKMRVCSQKKKVHHALVDENMINMTIKH